MGKEKKITIKYFVNTGAKPIFHNGVTTYPLYLSITYNRVTTKIKIEQINEPLRSVYLEGEDYRVIDNPQDFLKGFNSLYYDKNIIEKIIRNEIRINGDDFSILGIGQRLKYFYDLRWNSWFFPDFHKILDRYFPNEEVYLDSFFEEKRGMGYSSIFFYYYVAKYFSEENLFKTLPTHIQDHVIVTIFLSFYFDRFDANSIVKDNIHTYFVKSKFLIYEWIATDFKTKFITFLYSIEDFKKEFSHFMNVQTKHLLNDITFDKNNISRYISSVDSAVDKRIREGY